MDLFQQAFSSRHVVLPVVHVASLEQALRNTQIARDARADGVFLINHSMSDEALLDVHDAVADAHPDWWVGVNCLGMWPDQVFRAVGPKVDGVWVDNAGIDEGQEEQLLAESLLAIRDSHAPGCLYFGGVAFKYQRHVDDLEAAARIAAPYMDVVTSSGPGTGHAAEVEKIRRMREALGETPLAIASGITPENIEEYLSIADCFLVATGISRSFTELEPQLVMALIDRVRSFEE